MALAIVHRIISEIGRLPADIDETQTECVAVGCDVIDSLLIGTNPYGTAWLTYYELLVGLHNYGGGTGFGTPTGGRVHWTLEAFAADVKRRRRNLLRLFIAPDASWPVVPIPSRPNIYVNFREVAFHRLFFADMDELVRTHQVATKAEQFQDMLTQSVPWETVRATWKKSPLSGLRGGRNQILDAIMLKIKACLKQIRRRSDYATRREGEQADLSDPNSFGVVVPAHLDSWELMNEVADQLYTLVSISGEDGQTPPIVSFEEVVAAFENLVGLSPPDGGGLSDYNTSPARDALPPDNGLIWLLLQLFHNEMLAPAIGADFYGQERLLSTMIKMFNTDQLHSADCFHLRDLSLHCAITHQLHNLKERHNLRQRHPELTDTMPYVQATQQLHAYFNQQYKANVNNSDCFKNMSLSEMVKIGLVSQSRQNLVAHAFYVYIVPSTPDSDVAVHPGCRYLKGGALNYQLIAMLTVHTKQRILQLLHKSMLGNETGPRVHVNPGANVPVTCISPYVLDTAYKLIYSAPYTQEVMVKEMFEKSRKVDRAVRSHAESQISIPDYLHRWQHAIVQLWSYRLLRYMELSPMAPRLLDAVKNSLSDLEHWERFREVEMLTFRIQTIQRDGRIYRYLTENSRPGQFWFGNSEMLARNMILQSARILKVWGASEIAPEHLVSVLPTLYRTPPKWSEQTLAGFPEALRKLCQLGRGSLPDDSTVTAALGNLTANSDVQQVFLGYERDDGSEGRLPCLFQNFRHQHMFLSVFWNAVVTLGEVPVSKLEVVRKTMLQFSPTKMSTFTFEMISYALGMQYEQMSLLRVFELFSELIWNHQLLWFEHVLFGLVSGAHDGIRSELAFKLLRYLLITCPEFSRRLDKWASLNVPMRYWVEDDHAVKLQEYLREFPEYCQFEAYAASAVEPERDDDEGAPEDSPMPSQAFELDPPLQTTVPVCYSNVLVRCVPVLDVVIGRLLDYNQPDILRDVLDRCAGLYRYHPTPLQFVRELLQYHHGSPVLNPDITKRIVRLLSFSEYDFLANFVEYVTGNSFEVGIPATRYFSRLVYKLAEAVSRDNCGIKPHTGLPERAFRECPNGLVLCLNIALVEILASPFSGEVASRALLSVALGRPDSPAGQLSAAAMHGLGLLFASLPTIPYAQCVFAEATVVIDSPYMQENTAPQENLRKTRPCLKAFQPGARMLKAENDRPRWRDCDPAIFPYLFESYAVNLSGYTTNEPNRYLTFLHAVLHFSDVERIGVFCDHLQSFIPLLVSDTQLLYVCALVGPLMYRLEGSPLMSACITEIVRMIHKLIHRLDTGPEEMPVAAAQILDFLNHVGPHIPVATSSTLRECIMGLSSRLQRHFSSFQELA